MERWLEHESLPTRELGTDRPGRCASPVGAGRSAMENTDWHQLEEWRFAYTIAAALERAAREQPKLRIVIVAPPKALGDLRADLHASLKACIEGEIVRDLTGHSVKRIEREHTPR
ncbi:MAG: host attachment protein [Proteobacteria bacterium]|nr:host attachment protein [Pseudomonadota bacterium]